MGLLLALLLAAGSTDAQVDALISEGIELRQNGKNEEALTVFRRAHELNGNTRALAQIGLVEVALGRWLDAEAHLTTALAATGDKWIDAHRETLSGALGTTAGKLGWLEITVKQAGARIRVNGQDLGRSPLRRPVRLVAGPAKLEIDAMGYQAVSRTITVASGGTTREPVELKTQALSGGVRASDAAQMSAAQPALVPPPDPEEESAVSKVPTLAWITGAVAVASTGVGVAGTIVQLGCGEGCDSSAGVVLMALGYGLGAIMAGLTVWQLIDAGVVGDEPPALVWIGPGSAGVAVEF